MRKAIILTGGVLLLALFAAIMIYPAGGSNAVRVRMCNRMRLKNTGYLILKHQEKNGWSAKSISDVFTSEQLRDKELLCGCKVDQAWKPNGWLNDLKLIDAYADVILVPSNRLGILVMERPGLWFQKPGMVAVCYVDKNKDGDEILETALYPLTKFDEK